MAKPKKIISFQGEIGANSDLACRQVRPDMDTLPCNSFEDTFAAVRNGKAQLALIPIDNTVAGRVADIHHLLPGSKLYIIGEYFLRVEHNLLAVKEAVLKAFGTGMGGEIAWKDLEVFNEKESGKPILKITGKTFWTGKGVPPPPINLKHIKYIVSFLLKNSIKLENFAANFFSIISLKKVFAKRYTKVHPSVFPKTRIAVPNHLPKIKPINKVGNNIGHNITFKNAQIRKKIIE